MSSITEIETTLSKHIGTSISLEEVLELVGDETLIYILKNTLMYEKAGVVHPRYFGDKENHNLLHKLELPKDKRKKLEEFGPETDIFLLEDTELRKYIEKYNKFFRFKRIKYENQKITNRLNVFKPIELYEEIQNRLKTAEQFMIDSIEFIKKRKSSGQILYKGSCIGLTYPEAFEKFEGEEIVEIGENELEHPISILKQKLEELQNYQKTLDELGQIENGNEEVYSFIGEKFVQVGDNGLIFRECAGNGSQLINRAIEQELVREGYKVTLKFVQLLKEEGYVKKCVLKSAKSMPSRKPKPKVPEAEKQVLEPPEPTLEEEKIYEKTQTPEEDTRNEKVILKDIDKLIRERIPKPKVVQSKEDKPKKTKRKKEVDIYEKYNDRPYTLLADGKMVKNNNFRMYIIRKNEFTKSIEVLHSIYSGNFEYDSSFYNPIKTLKSTKMIDGHPHNPQITKTGMQLIEDLNEIFPDKFRQESPQRFVKKLMKDPKKNDLIIAYDSYFLNLMRLKEEEPREGFYGFYLKGRWIVNEEGERVIPFYNQKHKISEDAKDLRRLMDGKYKKINWNRFPILLEVLNSRGVLKKPLEFEKRFVNLIINLPKKYKRLKKIKYGS